MASAKFTVTPFDGKNNFGLWQIKMKALLRREGNVKALEEAYPDDMTTAEQDEMDEKAHSAIQLSLHDDVLREVADEDTAGALWKKLETLYMTKSLTTKLYLKKRLYTLRMKEGTSLQNHLNEFNQIIMDIKNIGIKLEEEDHALLLICSLPSSYENVCNSMLYGKDTIKLEDVKATLNSAELKNKLQGSSSDIRAADGLTVRGRSKSRDGSKGAFRGRSNSKARNNVECYYCHKKGHYKADCYALKKKENQKGQSSYSANMVLPNDNDNDATVLTACIANVHSVNDWILDTGASYHMCLNRDWFSTYEPMTGGSILMGNDAVSQVIGIGTVSIKCHDGVVRTLTDVRHVPDLRMNLLSLGTLASLGCKFSGQEDILKITKGSLIGMKGSLKNGLYVLHGTTITGFAGVSSLDSQQDETKLWHMRLGHMSKKGMDILSKRDLLCGDHTASLDFCEHCVYG